MDDICKNIKLAREYAILNNYETSSVILADMATQIDKYAKQTSDMKVRNSSE